MEFKMITCSRCGKEMPELRLTRFGYDFCVNCSREQPRIGRVITLGEGDHTWTEIEFLNPETARKISEFEKQKTLAHLSDLDLVEEDSLDETLQEISYKLTVKKQNQEEEEEDPTYLNIEEDEDEDEEDEDFFEEESGSEEEFRD